MKKKLEVMTGDEVIIEQANEMLRKMGKKTRILFIQRATKEDVVVLYKDLNQKRRICLFKTNMFNEEILARTVIKSEAGYWFEECKKDWKATAEYIEQNVFPIVLSKEEVDWVKPEIVTVNYLNLKVKFALPAPVGLPNQYLNDITKEVLDDMNITLEQLLEMAIKNATQNTIYINANILIQKQYKSVPKSDTLMISVTNKTLELGFASILSKDVRKHVLEMFAGQKVAILPSSIHEAIAFPYRDKNDLYKYHKFVQDTNEYVVSPEDVLKDSVYSINPDTYSLKLEIV